jgi:hypothetical protein
MVSWWSVSDEWLRYLNGKGRFRCAELRINYWLPTALPDGAGRQFCVDHAEWVTASRKVLDNQLAATLYQVAGRPRSWDHLDGLVDFAAQLVGSTLQIANVVDHEGKLNDSVSDVLIY